MYLKKEQLIDALKLGRSVEQWIGITNHPEYVIIKWLRIDQEKNKTYSVSYFEVFDDGNDDFLDIYEFEPFEPDQPYGVINNFSDFDQALSFCYKNHNASEEKFVNAGMIQEEYRKYLESK
jgi:hypothetical protein